MVADDYAYEITRYGAQFSAVDPEPESAIPEDAKNDVAVRLHKSYDGGLLYSTHSPDTIDYFVLYTEELDWRVPRGTPVFGRFLASFDKRNVSDSTCVADTASFFWAADPGVEEPDPQFICDKTSPEPCYLIKP